jgi:GTP cyclohydrolase I
MTSTIDLDKVAAAVDGLLTALGVDEGDHTADTPRRVAKSWAHQLAGYAEDPAAHLERTFTAPSNPGLVIQTGIRVASTCAHHLLPITGYATVAYRPRGNRVVGLSKLARLVDGYARRLQVQEQLGRQVTDALFRTLAPYGAGCLITATHGCMALRGVQSPGATTTTHAWAGGWQASDQEAQQVIAEHLRRPAHSPTH